MAKKSQDNGPLLKRRVESPLFKRRVKSPLFKRRVESPLFKGRVESPLFKGRVKSPLLSVPALAGQSLHPPLGGVYLAMLTIPQPASAGLFSRFSILRNATTSTSTSISTYRHLTCATPAPKGQRMIARGKGFELSPQRQLKACGPGYRFIITPRPEGAPSTHKAA